jgi:predicted phage terminase large subunit-like protein
MLEHLRQMIGEYNFAGQYQQAPTPLRGGLVKAAWFKHYAVSALPPSFERLVQSWHTANKATELSDFSVCTTWGIAGNNLYLVDLVRRRMEYPELMREVRAQYERFRPSVVLIEDKASGTPLIREGLYAVARYQPQTDKVMRMHGQTAMIENGFVYLPDVAPWSSRTASMTTRTTLPRSCSTGTREAAAPAPTPGSSSFTGSAPKKRAGCRPRASVGFVCAFLPASAIAICSC